MSCIRRILSGVLVFVLLACPSLAKADPVVGAVECERGLPRDANQEQNRLLGCNRLFLIDRQIRLLLQMDEPR